MNLVNEETKKILASWSRVFVAAALALYSTGVTDPKLLINAGVAALLPVVIRYFNPNDHAFGKGADKK